MNFIIKAGPVIIPIILGSIVGLAIIIEKIWRLHGINKDAFEFSKYVFDNLKKDRIQEALNICERNIRYPLAEVFKVGIEKRNRTTADLERVLERVGNRQIIKLEKYLGGLATVIGIEPLLGFLGTIVGLIHAFMSWEKAGANITVSILAAGIYEAMITTAAGLLVAIICYIFYNYFTSRIKYITNELNDYSIQLLEILSEIRK